MMCAQQTQPSPAEGLPCPQRAARVRACDRVAGNQAIYQCMEPPLCCSKAIMEHLCSSPLDFGRRAIECRCDGTNLRLGQRALAEPHGERELQVVHRT
jgi:hypothetical protein